MAIIFYTGPSAVDVAQAATAHGQHLAKNAPTLLFSFGPAHYLPFANTATNQPRQHSPNCDLLSFNAADALAVLWEQGRATMPTQLRAITSAELPLLPGLDMLLGFQHLEELAKYYTHIVAIAAPHEMLIQALGLTDGLRWGVRLLFGLDRGPGANTSSVARALLPTAFLPFDLSRGQEFRVQAEEARTRLLHPQHTSARFVLPATPAAIPEARLAVAALHLHNLRVDGLLVGPFLADAGQNTLVNQAKDIWPNLPVLPFSTLSEDNFAQTSATRSSAAPISYQHADQPAVVVTLPGLPGGSLMLTLSGDELVLQIGPYRRSLLLPETLRGVRDVKATRQGDLLIIRKR